MFPLYVSDTHLLFLCLLLYFQERACILSLFHLGSNMRYPLAKLWHALWHSRGDKVFSERSPRQIETNPILELEVVDPKWGISFWKINTIPRIDHLNLMQPSWLLIEYPCTWNRTWINFKWAKILSNESLIWYWGQPIIVSPDILFSKIMS